MNDTLKGGNLQPLVSIIICFYNEQPYLERCINSVINQTYKNLQLILVNDGSTDNSLAVAQSFQNKIKHIQIFSTTNQGLGVSRNNALKHAQGEFLTFLDADDELMPEMIEKCCDEIIKTKSDLIVSRFTIAGKNGTQQAIDNGIKNVTFGEREAEQFIKEVYQFKVSCTVWAKLYHTKTAKKISFPASLWFEDRPYLLQYMLISKQATLVPFNLVRINKRAMSITRRTIEQRRINDLQKVFEMEVNFVQKNENKKKLMYLIAKYHMHVLLENLLLIRLQEQDIIEKKKLIDCFISSVKQTQLIMKQEKINLSLKDKVMLHLLMSPDNFGWNISGKLIQVIYGERIKSLKNKIADE